MDHKKYSTLMDALKDIADPRKARGQRFEWSFLLALICAALASGKRSGSEISDWVMAHADELVALLQPRRGCVASGSTLRRVLQIIPLQTLEQRVSQFSHDLTIESAASGTIITYLGEVLHGQSMDGKTLRGVQAHGQPLHLISLVQHGSGKTLAQVTVDKKANEISAAPQLLNGRDLAGTVTTMDALLAQRTLAQQILDQHGHYLMVVKRNQSELYEAIALLFDQGAWTRAEKAREYQIYRTVNKGHGRLETRTLESSPTLNAYLDWPSIGQVMRRRCRRLIIKTGQLSDEITYGITDLRPEQVGAAKLEALWRGHWTIENRVHRVRDVTLGEDACQIHIGDAPQTLAVLRNGLLALLRHKGWTNIAESLRHYEASVSCALKLIGAIPAGL
jgi:predicted transposase YbfD/YdcC